MKIPKKMKKVTDAGEGQWWLVLFLYTAIGYTPYEKKEYLIPLPLHFRFS